MPTVTYRGVIRRSPEDVFAFVADAENNPRWHQHVRETRWIDDPPNRVGRRGRQEGHLWGRDWVSVAEIAEWEPPHGVTFQVIEGMRVRTAICIDPHPEGALVELTVTTPAILGRRLDGLLSRVMKAATRNREAGDFRRLREALERA
jgi:uncharacterized protein YndB with AHSA1/START domain